MEAFYLLATILSNFLKSLTLSLLLLFRTLLPRHWFSRSSFNSSESVSLYEGTVWHERRRPVRHSFRYPVRYALYNLDHAPHAPPDHLSADQARQIASTNGQVYVYARHSHPHVKLFLFMFLSVTLFWGLSLRFIQLCHMLMCKGVNFFFSWVSLLLTIPPSVGYEQNPLSVYYCYDVEAEAHASASTQLLKKCIAEVCDFLQFTWISSSYCRLQIYVMHTCCCAFSQNSSFFF